MKNMVRYCRHLGWRIAVAGLLLGGATSARANDWGTWPVPWPPADGGGSQPPPVTNPGPPIQEPPPGGGNNPPPIDIPPPGAEPPPDVPVPLTPPGASSPEPASAVMGLFGVGAGVLAWRRKRLG
jgi:hypothetical protein